VGAVHVERVHAAAEAGQQRVRRDLESEPRDVRGAEQDARRLLLEHDLQARARTCCPSSTRRRRASRRRPSGRRGSGAAPDGADPSRWTSSIRRRPSASSCCVVVTKSSSLMSSSCSSSSSTRRAQRRAVPSRGDLRTRGSTSSTSSGRSPGRSSPCRAARRQALAAVAAAPLVRVRLEVAADKRLLEAALDVALDAAGEDVGAVLLGADVEQLALVRLVGVRGAQALAGRRDDGMSPGTRFDHQYAGAARPAASAASRTRAANASASSSRMIFPPRKDAPARPGGPCAPRRGHARAGRRIELRVHRAGVPAAGLTAGLASPIRRPARRSVPPILRSSALTRL
jgi:hypothetical protein